ncbi:MAG: DUF1579 family protein [Phycisphaerae bacterium]|jgi:hypothetical protein|nr:DUF1579 family protein [Phycisphaerae bacterium]
MKRTKFSISILISAIVVASLANGAIAAEKPAKTKPAAEPSAELKLLYKFVGEWQGTTIVHKTKQNPNEIRDTHTLSCVRVLGGRFTMSKIVASDGTTGLHLTTYDMQRKCYRIWFFDSRGFANEVQGKWDGKTKIFTWRSTDKENTTVTRSWYADDNAAKWNSEAKDPNGEVIFRMQGKYTRVKQLPKPKDAPKGKPAERSTEQKVLDLSVGDWKGTATVVKAPGNPKAVSLTGTQSVLRVLGGRFIQENGKASDGGAFLDLRTYDVRRKCYRMWFFHSQGSMTKYTGKWNAKTKTMTWLSDQGNGGTSGFKVQYPDDNTVKWSLVVKDPDGKAVFRMKGKNTRVKKPAKKKGS